MYKLCHPFIASLVILALPLAAQFGPEKIIESCEICGLETIEWVDLDGDGNNDIFTTSVDENKLIWLKNEGEGKYAKPIVIFDGVWGLVSGDIADLDSDGDLDIMAVGHKINGPYNKGVFILINEGNGSFKDTQVFLWTEFTNIDFIVPEDMDQDQDMDILFASNTPGKISWFQNDGQGNFNKVGTITQMELPLTSIETVDLDNDKRKDILISYFYSPTNYPGFRWLKNEGAGVYTMQEEIYAFLNQDFFNPRATPLDVNGDQLMDIVGSNRYNIQIHVNKGNGKFKTDSILIPLLEEQAAYHFNIADLDADGYTDLVFDFNKDGSSNEVETFIGWSRNLGNGQYALPEILTICYGIIENLQVMDIDSDKDVDILYGFRRFDGIHLLRNKGNLNFSDESINTSKLGGLRAVLVTDLDGDRKNDLLSASFFDRKIAWYKNLGAGKFSEQKIISDQMPRLGAIQTGDMDADRDMDIVVVHRLDPRTASIAWFRNDQNNGFSKEMYIYPGHPLLYLPNSWVLADLDNDGDSDILLLTDFQKNLVLIKNEGRGNFAVPRPIDQSIFIDDFKFLTTADLDKDGFVDIVLVKQGRLSWYRNKKDGTFEENKSLAERGGKFIPGDFDFDGDIDLLSQEDQVYLYSNDGDANFSTRPIIKIDNIGVYDFQAADFDGDQDLDLVISSKIDAYNKISWYENTASGLWKNHEIYNVEGLEENFVEVGDLDEDGDMDVVFFNELFNKIAWFENQFNYPTISGVVYWDENENEQFDSTERILKNIPLLLSPRANSTFTGTDGKFRFYVPRGIYQLSAKPDSCWDLTTVFPSYVLIFDGIHPLDREFGYKLAAKAESSQPRIFSAPTRCGFETPFVVSLENDGCLPSKGKYGLVLSPRLTLINASQQPDQIRGDTLLWDYRDLIGAEITQLKLNFRIAGTDFIGDTIKLTGLAYTENAQGQLKLANTYDYRSEIRCAYDPNDKLSFPNRRSAYPRNYTLFKEEMEFLVRFQNTGNDTAFTVVIRDTLDKNLDWSTFRPLVGSHPFETHIQENGALSFTFKNILLPDNKTNEALSHGFVSYRVSPKKGLPEQTEIQNTAYIYFDFNPPIQTNTTSNVMVSSFPRLTNTRQAATDFPHRVYPNPFQQQLWLELDTLPNEYTVLMYNGQAQLVHSQLLTSKLTQLNTAQLSKGLYWYLLKDKHGHLLASGKIVAQ